jgi:hypothetical protein
MWKGLAAVVLCCGVGLMTACSDKGQAPITPTPQTTNVAGTWAGQVSALGTAARMTWTLSQTGTAVNGPVLLTVSSGLVLMNGFLTGSVSGTTLTYVISVAPGGIPLQPACAGQITGTMAVTIEAVSTMAGTPTISSSTCAPPFPTGPLTLTKQ